MAIGVVLFAIGAAVGFGLAWVQGARVRRELRAAQEALASSAKSLSDTEQNLKTKNEENQALDLSVSQARQRSQELTLRITELERRVHDAGAWEVKYGKLLKDHSQCATKLSELEKTKVELSFCQQQLEALRKKSQAGEAAKT